jgi:hypothetical protein
MQKYVYSTVSTNVSFVLWSEPRPNRYPSMLRKVNILGGANVAQGGHNKGLWTPKGVATPVSDADLEFLNADAKFQEMVRKGFMSIGFDERDADKAAGDMCAKDKSAPKTPADFTGKVGRGVQEIAAA